MRWPVAPPAGIRLFRLRMAFSSPFIPPLYSIKIIGLPLKRSCRVTVHCCRRQATRSRRGRYPENTTRGPQAGQGHSALPVFLRDHSHIDIINRAVFHLDRDSIPYALPAGKRDQTLSFTGTSSALVPASAQRAIAPTSGSEAAVSQLNFSGLQMKPSYPFSMSSVFQLRQHKHTFGQAVACFTLWNIGQRHHRNIAHLHQISAADGCTGNNRHRFSFFYKFFAITVSAQRSGADFRAAKKPAHTGPSSCCHRRLRRTFRRRGDQLARHRRQYALSLSRHPH